MASYLQDHLCPQLIGRDAHRIEDIWQFFYKGAYCSGQVILATVLQ
ncbi:mandelate racemase / muconate lactonizing enzyme, N-terminal domain protein [Escherichia coli 179550]|nr:mandelate racemase / muconate lactonizing enzyme, N-terminal domain protein [Escherichia coli 179550]